MSWLAGSVLSIFLCPQTTLSETLEKQPIENIISIHPLLLPPWLSIQLLSCICLCDPFDCSPQGSSVHGILQARILEWVAIPCPGHSPNPGNKPPSPALAGRLFTTEPPRKPIISLTRWFFLKRIYITLYLYYNISLYIQYKIINTFIIYKFINIIINCKYNTKYNIVYTIQNIITFTIHIYVYIYSFSYPFPYIKEKFRKQVCSLLCSCYVPAPSTMPGTE